MDTVALAAAGGHTAVATARAAVARAAVALATTPSTMTVSAAPPRGEA